MKKQFNTAANCNPAMHYMVDTTDKIDQIIQTLIEQNRYFTINRGRQYGKTTTLAMLQKHLQNDYYVLFLSFEGGEIDFSTNELFVRDFINLTAQEMQYAGFPQTLIDAWKSDYDNTTAFAALTQKITALCSQSDREVILMIDEVDKNSHNDVFIDFLSCLRNKYIRRNRTGEPTFKSVILTGVYDIKNLRAKMRPDEQHTFNSPWNIAVPFLIDMSLPADGIQKMLEEYAADYCLDFDTEWFAQQIYDYTSGYPFLVSRLCQILHEQVAKEQRFDSLENAWTKEGFLRAEKILIGENNPLFDDLSKKLNQYSNLKSMVYAMLLQGKKYSFNQHDDIIQLGLMFGWLTNQNETLVISNRIFETVLTTKFISEMETALNQTSLSWPQRTSFIHNECLDMQGILESFMDYFNEVTVLLPNKVAENDARLIFLAYIHIIINGNGNFYIETPISESSRTDVIIDYNAVRYIVELKIWHGEVYEQKGREQLCRYLDRMNLDRGYLVSFCFNKNKEQKTGVFQKNLMGKHILEVIV